MGASLSNAVDAMRNFKNKERDRFPVVVPSTPIHPEPYYDRMKWRDIVLSAREYNMEMLIANMKQTLNAAYGRLRNGNL